MSAEPEIKTDMVRIVATYREGDKKPFAIVCYALDGWIYSGGPERLMQARCSGVWRQDYTHYQEWGGRFVDEVWSGKAPLKAVFRDEQRIRRWDG